MNKTLKKTLGIVLSLAMTAGTIVLPAASASAAVGDTWKFDFGASDQAEVTGWTKVGPDLDYYADDNNLGYGFLGLNESYYEINGGRIDGFNYQEGQQIQLQAGGGTGTNDGIGSVGADSFNNAGDKYYPVSFALDVPDDTYYKVKATVTTLDTSKAATASLYTERKHPLYTEKTIAAGETVTTEFTVRVTPIYYQKSNPTGAIADGRLTVSVLGENTALASVEIEQIETARTLWVLGDSTVTDGGADTPFFPLANYTGVGTGLTKYLSKDIAMVNEGEGGLATNDTTHFGMVYTSETNHRIKAGDFLFVEYGHNDDSTSDYKTNMEKYYNACKEVGATLIVVAPIDRLAIWNGDTKKYDETHAYSNKPYSVAGKEYVDAKVAAGATDIAFVDLTTASRNWYQKLADDHDGAEIADFYFRTPLGGSADTTHPNDTGADNLAYLFFDTAKKITDETQKAAIAPLLQGMTEETPAVVSETVIAGGLGGTAWPAYVPPITFEHPLVIKDVTTNEDGTFKDMSVQIQTHPDYYAKGVVEVLNEDGTVANKYVTENWIENTADPGTQVLTFGTTTAPTEDQTFRAYMWPADLSSHELLPESDEHAEYYSSIYTPAGISAYILPGKDGTVEKFDYLGSKLTDNEKYKYGGSSGLTDTLEKDGSVTYANIISNGAGGSFFVMRALENLKNDTETEVGTLREGKYMFDADLKYISGEAMTFELSENANPSKSPFVLDKQIAMFTVGSGGDITIAGQSAGKISGATWSNVRYILDMNTGKASLSVAGGTPVEIDVPDYQTYSDPTTAASTYKWFAISGGKNTACGIKISNMTVAKLREDKKTTLTIAVNEAQRGSVKIDDADVASKKVLAGEYANVKAIANDGSVFANWTTSNGQVFSRDEEISVRMYNDLALTANFVNELGNDSIADYKIITDKSIARIGLKANLSLDDVQSAEGVPIKSATNADVTWSSDTPGVTISADGVVSLDATNLPKNITKDVTITGKLNNVEKTCKIKLYTYEYYEPLEGGVVQGTWDGDYNTVASKNAIAFPGGNGKYTLTLPAPVNIENKKIEISYIAAGNGSTCGQARSIEFYDNSETAKSLFNDEEGPLMLGYSWTGFYVGGHYDGSKSVNTIVESDKSFSNAFALNTWSQPMKITLNGDGTGTVAFGAESAEITYDTDVTEIDKIVFKSASGAPDYLARGLNITDLTIKEVLETPKDIEITTPTVTEGTLSFSITNNTNAAYNTGKIVVASYNDNNTLKGIEIKDAVSVAAAQYPGSKGFGTTETITATVSSDNWKIMFWNGVDTIKPVHDPIQPEAEAPAQE